VTGADEILHQRLENWGAVYQDRYRKQCSPGFERYRSPDLYHDGETPRVLDYRDAERVQTAWLKLGARDRVLLGGWYILLARPEILIRRVNRIGPTIITRHTLEHYIRWAERRLAQHLARGAKTCYASKHNSSWFRVSV